MLMIQLLIALKVEVLNGCVCCTVRGDLSEALVRIYENNQGKRKFDACIIEVISWM